MAGAELRLQEFVNEPDCLSVIIRCGTIDPGPLENIQPGHVIFDYARRILEGKLMENDWIDASGDPNGCDLDLRTLIGQDAKAPYNYFFCLSCLKLPKGTLDVGESCFRRLAPDETADDTGSDNFKIAEPGEIPDPIDSISAEDDADSKGKHTLDDLLNGT